MTEQRIKELMMDMGMPNSVSLQSLIYKVINEVEQDLKKAETEKIPMDSVPADYDDGLLPEWMFNMTNVVNSFEKRILDLETKAGD